MSFITVGGIAADVSEDDEEPVITVITRGARRASSYLTKGANQDLNFTVKPSLDDLTGLTAIRTAKKNATPLVVRMFDGPVVAGTNYDQYSVVITSCAKTQPESDVLTYSVKMKHTTVSGVSDSFDQTYA